ncbi:MAG: hypothetical protein EXR11_04745 [Rhodospirillaceae bacterium]|nr:hypothetical protein [Rhodospirillaceae bacterium]
MNLILGTVQFGLAYGATNARGRVESSEIERILDHACDTGVTTIDTAAAYGESESALGKADIGSRNLRIITKLPKITPGLSQQEALAFWRQAFAASLQKLGVAAVDGLMAHDCGDLTGPHGPELWALMGELRQQGLTKKIGASVYDHTQIDALLERRKPDLVQLPYSVLDQRLRQSGHLARLAAAGVEIHARSIFLQGVILAGSASIPRNLMALRPAVQRLEAWAATAKVSMLQAALLAVHTQPAVAAAVVGVTSLQEFREITRAWRSATSVAQPVDLMNLAVDDPALVDPRVWPQ